MQKHSETTPNKTTKKDSKTAGKKVKGVETSPNQRIDSDDNAATQSFARKDIDQNIDRNVDVNAKSDGEKGLEGEGSYTGTRKYDAGVRDFVKSGQVDASARDAEKAVDGPEGKQLKDAEKAGKRGYKH